MAVLLLLLGFLLLVIGGEYIVRSAVALSFRFRLSKMVIGLTVVAFTTSFPELLVSLQAAVNGQYDISLGNVIGSNIANIGLVLGLTAIIAPIWVNRSFFKWNWPVMIFLSVALYLFLKNDYQLSRIEGGFLLGFLVLFLIILVRRGKQNHIEAGEAVNEKLRGTTGFKIIFWLLIGGFALYFGSKWLVSGATTIAENIGVSDRVISISVIAIGTSLPEMATSVLAALKQEKAISLGNLVGSNIFNIAAVLGVTALVQPISTQSERLLHNDIFWMVGFSLILLPLAFLPKKLKFSRYKGFVIFIGYLIFMGLTFFYR